MKKIIIMLAAAIALAGCGSHKKVTEVAVVPAVDTVVTHKPVTYEVTPHPDVITIAEGMELLSNPDKSKEIASKRGYKVVGKYAVYRLDNYEMMMFKNCKLPKKLGEGIYEDTPKPLVKGTSSYVALNGNVLIAVFNQVAFQNLVEQVKGLGFSLVEQGYEDKYTLGSTAIYVYEARKSLRIERE